jgi:hypothetical protein
MTTPNYQLLREAYYFIKSIPDDAFKLDHWIGEGTPECKTLACAGGWLPSCPTFRELGLRNSHYYGAPSIPHEDGKLLLGYPALAELFGIPYRDVNALFGARDVEYAYDPEEVEELSDKELWLARMRNYLREKEQW